MRSMHDITLNDIRQVFQEELAAALALDRWLDSEEAARHISVSVGTLHNLVSSGRLPRYGEPGTALKFRRADLDGYMTSKGRRRRGC